MIYLGGFAVLYMITGTSMGSFLILLPVLALAWSFGVVGGISAALFMIVLNTSMIWLFSEPRGILSLYWPPLGGIFGYAANLLVGAIMGYISGLNRRLNRAVGELKLLQGLVHICPVCKRIRRQGDLVANGGLFPYYIRA